MWFHEPGLNQHFKSLLFQAYDLSENFTWILIKSLNLSNCIFVVLAFLFNGLFVINAFQVVLLLFLVDFVTISIATDNVRPSEKPETWNIASLLKTSIVLGIFVVVESFGLLYIGLTYLDLSNVAQLNTFVFDMLLFGGLLTIFVVRERGSFWKSKPSKLLIGAIVVDIIISSLISIIGIPGLAPIPAFYVVIVLGWFLIFGVLLNDQIKKRLIHLK